MRALFISAFALAAVACSPQGGGGGAATSAVGDWTVDNDKSLVSFVSIKNGEMGESHHFTSVGGGVSADGAARITIDLDSLETDTPIRNERMREHLFETANFKEAVVTAQLAPADFENLAPGERRRVTVDLNVDLHGVRLPTETELFVTRVGADAVLVETTEPIQVFADDFNMVPGLDKLKEIATLNSIQPVSPVTFSILLTR